MEFIIELPPTDPASWTSTQPFSNSPFALPWSMLGECDKAEIRALRPNMTDDLLATLWWIRPMKVWSGAGYVQPR